MSRYKIYPVKLKSKWEGPYSVRHVYPYGVILISNNMGEIFKVNGHRLKKYYGAEIDKENNEAIELMNDVT